MLGTVTHHPGLFVTYHSGSNHPGDHHQAPSGQPQPAEAGERQPYHTQDYEVRGNATQLRAYSHPRPQSQDKREQQNTGNNKPANPGEAWMNFRQAKH